MQVVSVEELQRHSTASDCWMAVNGLVYDVSVFLPDHPGGSEIVEALAGKDASADFEDALHSSVAREEPKIELKGVLAGWEAKVQEYRQQGWSEDKGIPDVTRLSGNGGSSMDGAAVGLGIALTLGAVGALAAAWFATRARKG